MAERLLLHGAAVITIRSTRVLLLVVVAFLTVCREARAQHGQLQHFLAPHSPSPCMPTAHPVFSYCQRLSFPAESSFLCADGTFPALHYGDIINCDLGCPSGYHCESTVAKYGACCKDVPTKPPPQIAFAVQRSPSRHNGSHEHFAFQ